MENILDRIPTFNGSIQSKLAPILKRSRKRKPSNQNQVQTRRNRNVVQAIMEEIEGRRFSPEQSTKMNWLDEFDRALKDQYHEANAAKPKSPEKAASSEKVKKPRVFKVVMPGKSETPVALPVVRAPTPPKPAEQPSAADVEVAAKSPGKFPTLFSVSKTGKNQMWMIEVIRSGREKTSPAIIRVSYGYEGGAVTVNDKEITKGKNLGKKNETTPFEQAVLEATSTWTKKKESGGYAEKLTDAQVPTIASDTAITKHATLLPMLAHDYNKRAKDITFPCYVQAKLDGVRSIFRNGVFTSRTGKPFGFLDHIVNELAPATKEGLILDGEIYSTTLGFQQFVGLVKKKKLTEKDKEAMKHVNLWVYDVVNDDPFETRLATLKAFFAKHKFTHVHLLPTEECKERKDVKTFHDKYVKDGNEGLILRNKTGLYKLATRSADLQKYKEFEDAEYKVIGFTEGEGLEKGLVIWICTTNDGKVFNVRPRGTHEERAELFKKGKEYIGKELTVRFQELTEDGIPRFPTGIAFRDYE